MGAVDAEPAENDGDGWAPLSVGKGAGIDASRRAAIIGNLWQGADRGAFRDGSDRGARQGERAA